MKRQFTNVASQNWMFTRNDKLIPTFFEAVDGRLKRVSEQRGIEMIRENKLPLSRDLKRYFEGKKITIL